MERNWSLCPYGVRGAFPVTAPEMLDYGGNTSCYLAETGGEAVILDAGSGLAALGRVWRKCRADILITHLHLDHVMGLFSFPLLFDPQAEVVLYGRPGFRTALEALIRAPYWPVGFADFPAKVVFQEVSPGERFQIGGITVDTLEGNHPNDCLYYRLEAAGSRLVYALDCELTEAFAPKLAAFARGADLLVWDANFVSADLRPGWGHSTWEQGLAFAKQAGVRKVLLTHYDRDYSSSFLEEQETLAQAVFPDCAFAREGKRCIASLAPRVDAAVSGTEQRCTIRKDNCRLQAEKAAL